MLLREYCGFNLRSSKLDHGTVVLGRIECHRYLSVLFSLMKTRHSMTLGIELWTHGIDEEIALVEFGGGLTFRFPSAADGLCRLKTFSR